MRIFWLIVLAIVIALSAFGQEKSGQSKDNKTFEVRTNLLVLDDKNHILEGIKQSDVKILENGVEQKLTYFAVKEPVLNLVIVADNTGSVREQLDQIIDFSKLVAANLFPADEAMVVRFVGRNTVNIVQPWTNDKRLLNDALDNLYIEGGKSAVIDSIYLSVQELLKRSVKAKDRKYAVVILTDGDDLDSYRNKKQLLELLSGTDIQVFKMAPTGTKFKPAMIDNVAVVTGGTSISLIRGVSGKMEYSQPLKALMQELRAHVVVGYTAQNVTKDNRTRKLTATVADGPNGEKRKGVVKETIVLPVD
jgi:VWFA-related protein